MACQVPATLRNEAHDLRGVQEVGARSPPVGVPRPRRLWFPTLLSGGVTVDTSQPRPLNYASLPTYRELLPA